MGFIPFTFIDFLDILLVAGFLFIVYRAMRGTNAPYVKAVYCHPVYLTYMQSTS